MRKYKQIFYYILIDGKSLITTRTRLQDGTLVDIYDLFKNRGTIELGCGFNCKTFHSKESAQNIAKIFKGATVHKHWVNCISL